MKQNDKRESSKLAQGYKRANSSMIGCLSGMPCSARTVKWVMHWH
jgi:hypothetical protein